RGRLAADVHLRTPRAHRPRRARRGVRPGTVPPRSPTRPRGLDGRPRRPRPRGRPAHQGVGRVEPHARRRHHPARGVAARPAPRPRRGARSRLPLADDTIPLVGSLLGLRLVYNPGAALSIATGMTWVLTIVVVAVVVVIVRMVSRIGSRAWAVALGLLLGGAL